ncbi:MAG: DUF4276 family protein [Polyangiaceae bacterium]|nr:DUF4276 family protein [Polyangiaceae bacterium]
MGKRVVVIASGETERMALPHLLRHLESDNVGILGPILTPPRQHALTPDSACKLVQAAWYWNDPQPDKFVILVDADGKDPQMVVATFAQRLEGTKCQDIPVPIKVVAAKWHLEAWFWADPHALRSYVGRDLGNVDINDPDAIPSPKQCLKDLLDVPYTARVAGEIAQGISTTEVGKRSRSFAHFEQAIRNGSAPT